MSEPKVPTAPCRECGHLIVWLLTPEGRRLPPHEYVGTAVTLDEDGRAHGDQRVFSRHRCRSSDVRAHQRRIAAEREHRERTGRTIEVRPPPSEVRDAAWERALPIECPTCHVEPGEFCVDLSPKAKPGQEKTWPHPARRIH